LGWSKINQNKTMEEEIIAPEEVVVTAPEEVAAEGPEVVE
jgi:hypothetical protein